MFAKILWLFGFDGAVAVFLPHSKTERMMTPRSLKKKDDPLLLIYKSSIYASPAFQSQSYRYRQPAVASRYC